MDIKQQLITTNFTKMAGRQIKWIVVHYFGSLGSDESVGNFFNRPGIDASAHYGLDNDSTTRYVLDKDKAYHCGDKTVGPYKNKCTNSNSIGIEVKPYKLNVNSLLATDNDWYFTDETIARLVDLVKYLMKLYDIDSDHVIRHYDVTNKWCPRPFMGDDINTYYNKTGNQKWQEFKELLKEEQEMTQEQFNVMMDNYLRSLKEKKPSEWSKESREWAETEGLIVGDQNGMKQYKSFITREEIVVLLHKFENLYD